MNDEPNSGWPGTRTKYGYDSAERPQSWADSFASSGPNVTITLGYSPADQITSRTRDNDAYAYMGYVNGSTAYSPNGLNQYASVGGSSVGYDLNGNLTSDGSTNTTYTYDTENRLLTATSTSSNATLIYDPLGRLFQVTGTSGTRQFLYDGDQLVAEFNGTTGALLRRYVQGPAGDDPLLWYEGTSVSSTSRRSLQADYKGSIQSVANASGNVLAINRYDEYGAPSADNLGTLQYTGQAWLSEVGLYYYKARMYNPRLGRFMQTDPIGYKDDLDLYAYVYNDPMDRSDPQGTQAYDGPWLFGTPNQWIKAAQAQTAHDAQAYGDASAVNRALSYNNRHMALTAASAALANTALVAPPTAEIALPASAMLSIAAALDKKITTGKLDFGDIVVTAIATAPGLGELGEAATGIKEVGEVVKSGQESLHAGATTLAAGAAVMETHASTQEQTRGQSGSSLHQNTPQAAAEKPSGTVRTCYGSTDDCHR